jgi:hypothetical protein
MANDEFLADEPRKNPNHFKSVVVGPNSRPRIDGVSTTLHFKSFCHSITGASLLKSMVICNVFEAFPDQRQLRTKLNWSALFVIRRQARQVRSALRAYRFRHGSAHRMT